MADVQNYPDFSNIGKNLSDLDSRSPPSSPSTETPPSSLSACTGLSYNDAAKQAVCEMDIPENLVQLAIDIQLLRHQKDFPSVMELYDFADIIAGSPELQARLFMELYQAQSGKRQETVPDQKQKELPEDVEADGMEVEPSPLKGFDEVDSTLVASCCPAEMLETPADSCTKANLHELIAENKKLKKRKFCRVCCKVELAVSGITFLPCGHFIACEDCAENCDDCPACGKNIMGTVRTFLS